MKILAITSGKGGVGKSTFSLNIARQLSLSGKKTLLVDFDIHNKGITSLFLASIGDKNSDLAPTSVTDLVSSSNDFQQLFPLDRVSSLKLVPLTSDGMLSLIPASLPRQLIQWTRFHGENEHIVSYFSSLFKAVAEQLNFDVIVIDCYGGIDSLTVAAAGVADDTIIVNEPDLVTFTGTILLYRYLLDQYRKAVSIPRVHFLINRIPSRYSFKFLRQIYYQNLADYSVDKQILAYFPYDKLIIETFGEYPFFSEILPRSLFTKKIKLLIEMLWNEDPEYAGFSGIPVSRRTKVFELTSEYFFSEPDRILRTFVRVPFFLIAPTLLLFLLARGVGGTLDYRTILAVVYTSFALIAVLALFIGFFEPLQISNWMLREAQYRRRKRILKLTGTVSTRVSSTVFDFGQATLPVFFGCAFLGALVYYAGSLTITSHMFSAHGMYKILQIWPGQISGLRPNADYSGIVLNKRASFSSGTDIHGSKFVGAVFRGGTFRNINFQGADFSKTYLGDCVFEDSNLSNVLFKNSTMSGVHFHRGTASGADFREAELPDVEFDNIDLTRARFSYGELIGADQVEPLLRGAVIEMSKEDLQYILSLSPGELASYLETQIVHVYPQLEPEIEQQLAVLDQATKDHDDLHRGEFLVLRLENDVTQGADDRQAAEEWQSYLKAHGGRMDGWFWDFWNGNLNQVRLSSSALAKLDLIQQSALGKITPEKFSQQFLRIGTAKTKD